MTSSLDSLFQDPGIKGAPPRVVLSQDGTTRENSLARPQGLPFEETSENDLFGGSQHYQTIKNERPEHRMMLWLKIKGHSTDEIAKITRYSPQMVRIVCKQDWFRKAFVRFADEIGRDAAETFLQGQEIPTLEKLVELRDQAENESVSLGASKELLDRIRGKAVIKQEIKSTSSVDMTVNDVTALMAERARNEEKLRSNGILTGTN